MDALLHENEDQIRSAPRVAGGPRTFGGIAELVQRYLGCDAAVLTIHHHPSSFHDTRRTKLRARQGSAAFRPGFEPCKIDVRSMANPLVAGELGMRFYAGLPLRDDEGHPIGMLAAVDQRETALAPGELDTVRLLAALAGDLYERQRVRHAA